MARVGGSEHATSTPNGFVVTDYELKVRYLTTSAACGRGSTILAALSPRSYGWKLIFDNGKLSPQVSIVGAIVSLVWYVGDWSRQEDI